MRRVLSILGLLAVSLASLAAPVPKTPLPNPKTAASVNLCTAQVKGTQLLVTATQSQPRFLKNETVTIEVNGVQKQITRQVFEYVDVPVILHLPLAQWKVTTVDGKALSADDVAKRLESGTAAVQCYEPIDAEWRKLFAADMLFLDPAVEAGDAPPTKK